jgi:putative ABC transport system permease protein
MITRIWRAFKDLVRRHHAEQELDEELRTHLERQIEQNIAGGMDADEARYAAQRLFGGMQQVKERCRDMRGLNFIETIILDLRYSLRQLRRNPGFTAVAVITLALGIGANTAIFSVVNAVLLRPLPYKNPERLVWAAEQVPIMHGAFVLSPDYAAWRDQSKVFQWIGAFSFHDARVNGANLTGGSEPARVSLINVTPDFFRMLGVRPILGRTFTADEGKVGQTGVALLSEAMWRTRFGGDRHVLGETIHLNGWPYTVIGVMPGTFRYPQADVWTTIATNANVFSPHSPDWTLLTAIGRIKPGVSVARAQAELNLISHRVDREYPPFTASPLTHLQVKVVPLHQLLVRNARPLLLILLGAVGFVLLIACVNVANLLLARAAARGNEMAVRVALGAGRARLVRQLLTECLLFAAMSGLLGFFAGLWSVELLKRLIPPNLPSEIHLDARVLGFVIGTSVAAVIFFGLLPAVISSRPDLNEALKEGGVRAGASHGAHRLRSLLVVGEIALSITLLIAAGLLTRSFVRLTEVPLGFEPHDVLLANVWRSLRFSTHNARRNEALESAFFHEVLERVGSLPGVKEAAVTSHFPLGSVTGLGLGASLTVRGTQATRFPKIYVSSISPDYFSTMGIRLLKGRFFSEEDVPSAPGVVILNQSLARALFHRRDPLGRQVSFGEKQPWNRVVGVVADTRNTALAQQPWPEIYLPYPQQPRPFMTLVVRAKGKPLPLAESIRKAVQSVDKDQPVSNVQTMDELIAKSATPERFRTLLLGLFAMLSVVLAAVGIYGVIAYSVSQRTHEIGVRVALGAQTSDVLRHVMWQGMTLASIGVAVGMGGAVGLTRFLSGLLYGVKPTDPLTFIVVSLLLTAVALLACYIPARRATKVDPMVALRHE